MEILNSMNKYFFLFLFFKVTANGYSQTDVSLETQIYPTGFIPSVSVDKHFGEKEVIYLRLGFNFFNHKDLGVQLNEEGSGYGLSVAYKRYLKETQQGIRLGIKTDLWFNTVQWTNINTFGPISGETKITVLQPTAELSYLWNFENIFFAPSIAFGFEWNVKTQGEPTGEGAILLVGAQLGKRF